LDELLTALRAKFHAALAEFEPYRNAASAILNYKISIDEYLVYSSVLSIFLAQLLTHKGIDIFLGYPLVLLNALLMLGQDRLIMHRNHAMAVIAVTVISFVASANSDTPGISIVAQILGIVFFSTFFLSLLTNFGLSIPRWIQIYTHFALGIVILGFITYVLRRLHLMAAAPSEMRLRSIFAEPSFFVYLTLPAFGIYANAFLRYRKYKLEVFLFFLSYMLAQSSLGFLGIFLIAFFGLLPRLSIWKMMGFGFAALGAFVALFFASANFRVRIADTAIAIAKMNFSQANASTFALLSNAYVAIQTFLDHPWIGIGIGGYQYAYMKYVPFISANSNDPDMVNLNMFDASSMFLRATAELGLVGLVSLIGFLIVCSRVRGDQHVDIRNALLPYLLIRMLRYGAWFSLELYFFVGLFVLNYLHSRARYNTGKAEPQANPL
jgi:O-antigen ligase